MDSLAVLGFIIACIALKGVYELHKRVKAIEKPIEQKRRSTSH